MAQRATERAGDTLRLSVEEAVARALRVADEVRLSAAQVDAAEAQVAAARANGLPQLRINSTYNHVYANARSTAVNSVFNQPNTYTVTATVGQTLFQGGRIVASTRAASDLRAAARFDEEETRAHVEVDVQRAYLDALYDARLADLQRENLALASARVAQLEKLLAGGRAARYDVLRARVERANIEPLLIQAENDRALAVLEVKRLLNIPVLQPLVLTSALDAGALVAADSSMRALEDSLARPDRPAVRSAERAVSSRRAGVTVARADFLPTVSLNFNTGYQAFPPLGFGFPSSFGTTASEFCPAGTAADRACQNGGWFPDRSLGATISVPVFDGLRARSNVEVARAQLRIAELQLQQERETVEIEVAKARASLRSARALFDARQQNSTEAREAFQLASLRFDRGLSTQLEVSDAQLALLTAESGEARASYDLYLAMTELARSMGHPIPRPPTATSDRERRPPNDIK